MGFAPPGFTGGPRSAPREGPDRFRQPGILEKAPGERGAKPASPQSSGLVSSKEPSKAAPFPRILFEQLARSLDIPQDALSSRLLSFLRYFSLPLEGEQIAKLRREVLASRPAGIAAGEQKTRAAVALGAVAAADKGIFLSPEALAEYAAAIDPEEGQSGDGEFNGKQGNSPEQQYPGREGEKRRNPSAAGGEGDDTPAAGDLRKKFESLPANQPLVDFLNRLPGKSGGRWIVFPFTFFSGDVAFRVSLRILLSSEGSGRDGPLLVLDIRGKRARWFFCLSGYGTAHSRADISLYPPLPRRALKIAEGELRKILGDFAEKIHMKNREAPFLAEEENQTPLPFVNEKV